MDKNIMDNGKIIGEMVRHITFGLMAMNIMEMYKMKSNKEKQLNKRMDNFLQHTMKKETS
jgi:hypothetical protein